MGNGIVERTGHLFIIILGVVILVIVGWGFGAPPGEPGTDPGPIRTLVAIEGDGQRPQGEKAGSAANSWPMDDREDTARSVRSPEPVKPVEPAGEDPLDPIDIQPVIPPPPSRDLEHVIAKKGETLWGVAVKYYHDGKLWPVIAQANPGVDPNDLTVGQAIRVPDPDRVLSRDAPDRAAAPVVVPADTYVVQEGDNLWKIAQKTLGNGAYNKKILDANPGVLTGNGDNLQAGMKLKIPR